MITSLNNRRFHLMPKHVYVPGYPLFFTL